MPPFRAAVFDLDGTLLDTLDDLADSANAMLMEAGFPAHPVDAYRRFVGDGSRVLVERILPQSALREPATVERCHQRYLEIYATGWNRKTIPYPGIPALLDSLAVRGCLLAVLSNKPHEATVRCVTHFCGAWKWAAVYGQREGVPHKPHPAGALQILEDLAMAPEEVLYLGDTGVDMQTATRAGLFPLGVLWGFRGRDELERAGARFLASTPAGVTHFLDRKTIPARETS